MQYIALIVIIFAIHKLINIYLDEQIKKNLESIEKRVESMRKEHPIIKAALEGDENAKKTIKVAYERERIRRLKK